MKDYEVLELISNCLDNMLKGQVLTYDQVNHVMKSFYFPEIEPSNELDIIGTESGETSLLMYYNDDKTIIVNIFYQELEVDNYEPANTSILVEAVKGNYVLA